MMYEISGTMLWLDHSMFWLLIKRNETDERLEWNSKPKDGSCFSYYFAHTHICRWMCEEESSGVKWDERCVCFLLQSASWRIGLMFVFQFSFRPSDQGERKAFTAKWVEKETAVAKARIGFNPVRSNHFVCRILYIGWGEEGTCVGEGLLQAKRVCERKWKRQTEQ